MVMGAPDGIARSVLVRVRTAWPIDLTRALPTTARAVIQGPPMFGGMGQPAIGNEVPVVRHGEPEILTLGLVAMGWQRPP